MKPPRRNTGHEPPVFTDPQPPPLEVQLPATCLGCGGRAHAFGVEQVAELLDHIMGRIGAQEFRAIVRRKLAKDGCAVAPKSGVFVCEVRR